MHSVAKKGLLAARRRNDDDDEGSIAAPLDDSSSTPSVPSDIEDDADAEGSEGGEASASRRNGALPQNGEATSSGKPGKQEPEPEPVPKTEETSFATGMAATETMMNGLKISGKDQDAEGIDIEYAREQDERSVVGADVALTAAPTDKGTTIVERRKKEHEEYKRKRDEDPSFVPNRGGFFMHDHRSSVPGQNGFRPSGRGGRGRGRGGIVGSFQPPQYAISDHYI